GAFPRGGGFLTPPPPAPPDPPPPPPAIASSATPIATASTAAAAVFAGTGLVDGQWTVAIRAAVEGFDRGLCFLIIGHFHEAETSAATAELVHDDLGARDCSIGLEEFHEIVAGGVVG